MHRWLARHGWAWAVGLGLTATAIAVCLTGVADSIEYAGFDFNVRHFSRVPASDRIVHIDIDDAALDRIGSWPWPRDLQGRLIRTLKDLGASQIIADIVWSEPKPPELRMPGLDRFADLEGMRKHIGQASVENLVFPDDELAAAVAEAGNVYLAMYYESARGNDTLSPTAKRVTDLIRRDFELDAAAVAERTRIPQVQIENILAGIKRLVAEERVADILARTPSATFEQIHKNILTTPLNRQTADRADVLAAYHRVLSLRTLRERCPEVPAGLKGRLPRISRVIPPIYKLTAGARRTGFVTFHPDRDGRTRHVPLLLDWDGRLLEHLAFAAARDVLGIDAHDLAIDDAGYLVIRGRETIPEKRIQLDPNGQILINWHVAPNDWPTCFTHWPVTLLLQLCECQQRIEENNRLREWKLAEIIRLTRDEAGFELYRKQVERMLEYQRRARWARLQGQGLTEQARTDETEARKLEKLIRRDHEDAVAMVREEWAILRQEPNPTDPRLAEEYGRFRNAYDVIDNEIADLDRTNAGIRAQYDRLTSRLRPLIEGRICFVGYTATAVADMVTTPPYRHVPGVLVHSNVLNGFLCGEFLSWSTPTIQIAVLIAFGATVTAVTATRGPWATFVFVIVVVTSGSLLNAFAIFARGDFWVRLMTAFVLTLGVWAMIVLLRYLTTEREKRRFSRAVAQYVSPAMARQLADRADNLNLAPVNGYVSCFFSDLVGFTPISERLGPEGTRSVLNPYLQVMSAALHQQKALINKFMGDGVFAFFNPPILPCADHEMAVCEAAIQCRDALAKLKSDQLDHPLAREFQRLAMRIGIASGPVFVGDYGSENKLDYTCVGDTVNLASRLEAANKAMGSSIMIDENTRLKVGDRFACRPLGRVLVQGRSAPVAVYELLGRQGEIDAETSEFARLFTQAVEHFQRRDWMTAAELFTACLGRRTDFGAALYLKAIERLRLDPPTPEWLPCVEVTGK